MTTPLPETALQKEQRLFQELVARLINAFLNRLYDLRPEKAIKRRRYLLFLFLLTGFLISLQEYPFYIWVAHIQDIYNFLFIPASFYTPNFVGNPFDNFLGLGLRALSDPQTLQYLPILLSSFFIALQSAASYLADIFELEDVSVARRFVSEVALGGSDETIRITQGDILEDHRLSPNYLIGGPGKVIVDIDSVALFEKPDGTPRVIGPTGKEPGGKATLEGFERFRQAIDLRDHYIELRDQNDKASSVKSRSRDGIPVTATDVRFVFSVYRDKQKPDDKNPYPFSREAIERLVYKSTSRVTPDLTNPSTFEFSWINNMVGLIRSRLGSFMSQHKLTEYLASIGMPEIEKLKQREKIIAEEKLRLIQADDNGEEKKENPPPSFQARQKVKNLFAQFTEEFTNKARENGVELHWIGVGTWESQVDIIPEKHLEAWVITQDNLKNDSPEEMKKFEQLEFINKMKDLIKKVPIGTYDEILEASYGYSSRSYRRRATHKVGQDTDSEEDESISAEDMERMAYEILEDLSDEKGGTDKTGHKGSDHIEDLKILLARYRNQLSETADLIANKNETVPYNLESAIALLSKILGYEEFHWVGKKTETELYADLVTRVGGSTSTANRLIEFERRQFPQESRAQHIQRAIERLDRDRQ